MNKIIDIKSIYENILNDKEIIDRYNNIECNEKKDGRWAYHNFMHIQNVTRTVEKILRDLKYDDDFIYKAKIACLLHDVGALEGKENHAFRSYEFAEKYFQKNNIIFEDEDKVLEAIKIHSDGFDTDNIIALSLILADKLDIKKSRISEVGKQVIGNRQYAHIEEVIVEIINNQFKVNFITDGKIDLKELNEFYFTNKIFKAIDAFSKKINYEYVILLDNNIWEK